MLADCVIIKDENYYLPEWIAYHSAVGVEHFYLHDNGSSIPISPTLTHEARIGRVTVIPFPDRCMQMPAYNDRIDSHRLKPVVLAPPSGSAEVYMAAPPAYSKEKTYGLV